MHITLPHLPYEKDALAPHLSAETIEFHYGKHHQSYVTKLNGLVGGTAYEAMPLDDIILASHEKDDAAIFNNAAQIWNHTFYWHCMKPGGGGEPSPAFKARLVEDFGSYDAFITQFKQAALSQFGSGWAWLVSNKGKLEIMKTSNAQSPLTAPGVTPCLTCDVWEHAYYIDYRNRRPDYVDVFLNHLVNWSFVESQHTPV